MRSGVVDEAIRIRLCVSVIDRRCRSFVGIPVDGAAKVLSGERSKPLPLIAFRLAAPELLVDLKHLQRTGSAHPTSATMASGWARVCAGAISKCIGPLPSPIRCLQRPSRMSRTTKSVNRGTVGGSIAHADPSAEMPGVAITCEAEMTIVGSAGNAYEYAARTSSPASCKPALKPTKSSPSSVCRAWPSDRRWAFPEFCPTQR